MKNLGLSQAQIEQYERDGILVVEDFLSPDEVESMRQGCWQLVEDMDPAVHKGVFSGTSTKNDKQTNDAYFLESNDKIRFFFEADAFDKDTGDLQMPKHTSLNKIGHYLHYLEPNFKKVTFSDKMKAVAKDLKFQDPIVVQGMYIFKNPRIGGVVTAHQDGTFLRNDPLKLVGYWFPIDDATLENGCLWYVPGSHKKVSPVTKHMVRNPLYNPSDKDNNESMLVFEGDEYPVFPEDQWVSAPCKKGSLVLIHGQVMHRSAKNTSDKPRHAYTFHMVETEGCVYRKTNWLQPPKNQKFPKLFEVSV